MELPEEVETYPEEVVEAAAKAWFERGKFGYPWEQYRFRDKYMEMARAVLESVLSPIGRRGGVPAYVLRVRPVRVLRSSRYSDSSDGGTEDE